MQTLSTLRPQSIGQIIDRTVRLYRRNFWTFLGIVALVQVPVLALSMLNVNNAFGNLFTILQDPLATPGTAGNPFMTQGITSLVSLASMFLTQFSSAALCLAVVHALFGEKLSIMDAYRKMWERWQSLAGMGFLLFVVSMGLSIIMIIGFIFLLIPGFFMLGVMFLFSYVAMPLMVPVLVLEGVGAWEAIKRAWNLARRRVWPLFGLMLVIALFVIALISGIQVVILTIFGVVVSDTFASGDFDAVFLSAAVAAVGFSALASVFVLPIQQSIATLIYLDLRMRNEGLDLAMAVVAPDSDPLEVIRNAPRQANSADLVESAEFGRFLGLGCAPVIFFFALYALTFGIVVALVGLIGTF